MGKNECKHSKSEDSTLFENTVGEVQPVNARKRHQAETKRKARANSRRKDEQQVLLDMHTGAADPAPPDFSEEHSFARGFVGRRTMRELRRGKLAVQAELDLHGLTREQARLELQDFLEACATRRLRCVRVVHGKGLGSGPNGPVLKTAVNRWLRRWDDVAAFCPARQCDGGAGALYVLLRN